MQYHIHTTPIWDAFKSDCECPLCEIYSKNNQRIVSQYLDEAVMEPDFRVKVNKKGFCAKHTLELYEGKNKLGLALQLNTRTAALIESVKEIKDVKSAKKQSEKLKNAACSCVICEPVNEIMIRHAYTVAQMYLQENEFPALLRSGKGFCLPHYILLLENCSRAGKKQEDYLKDISNLQKNNMQRVNKETERFTDMFDYRSTEKGKKGASEIVPRAINKILGKIIKGNTE